MASNYKVVEVPCTGDWENGRPWIMVSQIIYVGDMNAPHSDVWSWLKFHGLFGRDRMDAYDGQGWITASGVHYDPDDLYNYDEDEVNAALAPYVIDAKREAYGALYKHGEQHDWKALTIQVVALASQLGGQISWGGDVLKPQDAFMQTWGKDDYVAHCAPIKDEFSYYIALHEVGHIAFKTMYDPTDLATNSEEEELWCHHFALENAQIPISQSAIEVAMYYFEGYRNNKNYSEPSDANPGWLKDYPRQAAPYDQETEPDWSALQQEIEQWASLYDAHVTYDAVPSPGAYVDHYHEIWSPHTDIGLPEFAHDHLHLYPVTDAYTYAVNLHELGHVDFRMRYRDPEHDRVFESSQEEEFYAWHWMLEHSRIPLDQATLERVRWAYLSYENDQVKSPANPGWLKQEEPAPSRWDWLKPNWAQGKTAAATMYHITEQPPEVIQQEGIDYTKHPGWPKTDELYENDALPAGNYVWDTINNARIFGDYLNIHPAYIYTVDVNGLDLLRDPWFESGMADKEDDELFRGPHGIHGAFLTRDPIMPDRIRAIEKYDNYAWNNPYETKISAAQILIDTESNYKDGPVILDEHGTVWYGIGYHNHEQLQAEVLRNGGGYEVARAEIHHYNSMPEPVLYFGIRGNHAPTDEEQAIIADQLADAGVPFGKIAKTAGATFYRVTPTSKRDEILRDGLTPLYDSGGPRIFNQQYTDQFRVPTDPSTLPERIFSLNPEDHGNYDSDADLANTGMQKVYMFQTIDDAKNFAERYRMFEDQDLWQIRLPDTNLPMWHDDRDYTFIKTKMPPVFVNNTIPPEYLTLLETYLVNDDSWRDGDWVSPDALYSSVEPREAAFSNSNDSTHTGAALNPEAITSFIQDWIDELLSELGSNDLDKLVAQGYCADLAHVLWEHFDHSPELIFHNTDDPVHTWIEYHGKHYDMENPEGVSGQDEMKHFTSIQTTTETTIQTPRSCHTPVPAGIDALLSNQGLGGFKPGLMLGIGHLNDILNGLSNLNSYVEFNPSQDLNIKQDYNANKIYSWHEHKPVSLTEADNTSANLFDRPTWLFNNIEETTNVRTSPIGEINTDPHQASTPGATLKHGREDISDSRTVTGNRSRDVSTSQQSKGWIFSGENFEKVSEQLNLLDPFFWDHNAFIWTPETGLLAVYNHTEGIKQLRSKGIDPYSGVYGWTNPEDKTYFIETFNQREYQNSDNFKATVEAMQAVGYRWTTSPWDKLNENPDKDISLSDPTSSLSVEFPNRLTSDIRHFSDVSWEQFGDRKNLPASAYPDNLAIVYDGVNDKLYLNTDLDCAPYHPTMLSRLFDLKLDYRLHPEMFYFGSAWRVGDSWDYGWDTLEEKQGDKIYQARAIDLLLPRLKESHIVVSEVQHFELDKDEDHGDNWHGVYEYYTLKGIDENPLNESMDVGEMQLMRDDEDKTIQVEWIYVLPSFARTNAFMELIKPIFDYKQIGYSIRADFTNERLKAVFERWMGKLESHIFSDVEDVEQGDAAYEEPDQHPDHDYHDKERWDGSFWYDARDRRVYWYPGQGHSDVIKNYNLKRQDVYDNMVGGWVLNTTGNPFTPGYNEEGPFLVNTWGGDDPGYNDELPLGTKKAIEQALRDQLGLKVIESHVGAIIDLRDEPQSDAFPDLRQTARAVAFVGVGNNIYFGYSHPELLKQLGVAEDTYGLKNTRAIIKQLIDEGVPYTFGWADRVGPDDPWNVEITSGNYEEVNQAYTGYDEKVRRQVQKYLNLGIESHVKVEVW